MVKRTLYVCDVDSVKLFRKRRVYGFIQSLWMYAEKPGMGVEPIYSGSAGRRLNGSATPANYISLGASINSLSALIQFLFDLAIKL